MEQENPEEERPPVEAGQYEKAKPLAELSGLHEKGRPHLDASELGVEPASVSQTESGTSTMSPSGSETWVPLLVEDEVDFLRLPSAEKSSGEHQPSENVLDPDQKPRSSAKSNAYLPFGPAPAQLKRSASGSLVPDADCRLAEPPGFLPGVSKVGYVMPAMAKVVGNAVGLTAMAGTYVVGKAEMLVRGKIWDPMAESIVFRSGVQTWAWCNGIIPNITYESCPDCEDLTSQALIVSNHVSYIDGVVHGSVLGAPKVLSKEDVKHYPLFGFLAKEMGTIFVQRDQKGSKKAALEAIQGHIADWRPGDRPLLMFPEGTTSNGEGLLPFAKGAFVAGVPVRPVLLAYAGDWTATTCYREDMDGQVVRTSDAEWAANFFGHLLHLTRVHVLKPYVPSKEEQENPQLYANNVRSLMLQKLIEFRAVLGLCHAEQVPESEEDTQGQSYVYDAIFCSSRSYARSLQVQKSQDLTESVRARRASTFDGSDRVLTQVVVHKLYDGKLGVRLRDARLVSGFDVEEAKAIWSKGDEIRAINDRPVLSREDFAREYAKALEALPIIFTVFRKSQSIGDGNTHSVSRSAASRHSVT